MLRAPAVLLLLGLAGSAAALLQHTPGIQYCLTNPTAANCTAVAKLPVGAVRSCAAPLPCMLSAACCCCGSYRRGPPTTCNVPQPGAGCT